MFKIVHLEKNHFDGHTTFALKATAHICFIEQNTALSYFCVSNFS